jgi:hypothetical protein
VYAIFNAFFDGFLYVAKALLVFLPLRVILDEKKYIVLAVFFSSKGQAMVLLNKNMLSDTSCKIDRHTY